MKHDEIAIFKSRLDRLGIDVEFTGNIPWIYITKINGKNVAERFEGNHGFTVAFYPAKLGERIKFTDTREIFKLIRKYVTR